MSAVHCPAPAKASIRSAARRAARVLPCQQYNKLTGPLPAAWGAWRNMEELWLRENRWVA